jgi:hypothetical protein
MITHPAPNVRYQLIQGQTVQVNLVCSTLTACRL